MITTVLDPPVVTTDRHPAQLGSARRNGYVVVGVTDSRAAAQVLAAALCEARKLSAALVVVAVDEGVNRWLHAAGAPFLVPFPVLRADAAAVVRYRLMKALAVADRAGIEAVPVWRTGIPADVLAEVAGAYDARLVVVGRPSRGVLARMRRMLSGESVRSASLQQRTGVAVLCPG